LWQIETFRSKAAAAKRVAEMADLVSMYMVAARDGLPVRKAPSNAADRAYRLKGGEMVKVLKRVDGEALYTGGAKLAGDWYQVLTLDGTVGYAFSHTMRIVDENSGAIPDDTPPEADADAVASIFSRTWRPAWYAAMLQDGTVDTDYFSLRFGLFGDAKNRQIRVELPSNSKVFSYSSITQDEGWIVFGSTDLRVKLESPTSILASWGAGTEAPPDESAGWHPGDTQVRFVVVDSDIREAIRAEEARCSAALRGFFQAAKAAGAKTEAAGTLAFASPQAGGFELWPSATYAWKNTDFLPAGFAPASEGDASVQKGAVSFGLRLADSLAGEWQGGFSLYPESTGQRTDYVYRLESSGLRLARALPAAPGLLLSETDKRLGAATLDFARK
ncbi:SH3 domain-containing protein, partial [bacterium]|nr:SH3 domain-containing protein [bacterium]